MSTIDHTHVASLVLRPLDALRENLNRPEYERGPRYPVEFVLEGEVVLGAVRPLPPGLRPPVRNLSGDVVYRDLTLPAGTYRVSLERASPAGPDAYYEDLDAADRDVAWNPNAVHMVDGRPHPSHLHQIRLRPTTAYPFPSDSTLIRGGLVWYDGEPLTGAAAELAGALLRRSSVGPRGEIVLVLPAPAAPQGVATVFLDISRVDPVSKPQGAAFLALWPAAVQVAWARGASASLRHSVIRGFAQHEGVGLPGATVDVFGFPGHVTTRGTEGGWSYHFPPQTPNGLVDVRVQHPAFGAKVVRNLPHRAGATVRAPTVRFP